VRPLMLAAVIGGLVLAALVSLGLVFLLIGLGNAPRRDPPVAQVRDPAPAAPPARSDSSTPALRPVPGRHLPDELQAKCNTAIAKGQAFLRGQQLKDGRFGTVHEGTTYLAGLALLECGVPADDMTLKRVTGQVRTYMAGPHAVRTYDLSLALLYLDRLGDPADRPLIQSIALRLIAGQEQDGGWGYVCPRLKPAEEKAFLAALRRVRPEMVGELFVRVDKDRLLEPSGLHVSGIELPDRSVATLQAVRGKLQDAQRDLKAFPDLARSASLCTIEDAPPSNNKQKPPARTAPLPQRFSKFGDADNSNTQFAALGLWVAGRYDIPCERALALMSARFRITQRPNGGWSYKPTDPADTPSMTCAGLLALAIGHGVRLGSSDQKRADPQIQSGLQYLARHLEKSPTRNLYFVWSLERVGVLFNVEKVGKTDWYEWGTRHLVATQGRDGAWSAGGYFDANAVHDTCFALLFLKQANLVGDLSNRLTEVLDSKSIKDSSR
jgi:hypothetical protein